MWHPLLSKRLALLTELARTPTAANKQVMPTIFVATYCFHFYCDRRFIQLRSSLCLFSPSSSQVIPEASNCSKIALFQLLVPRLPTATGPSPDLDLTPPPPPPAPAPRPPLAVACCLWPVLLRQSAHINT